MQTLPSFNHKYGDRRRGFRELGAPLAAVLFQLLRGSAFPAASRKNITLEYHWVDHSALKAAQGTVFR